MLDKLVTESRELLSKYVIFAWFAPVLGGILAGASLAFAYGKDPASTWKDLVQAPAATQVAVAVAILAAGALGSIVLSAAQSCLLDVWTGVLLWPRWLKAIANRRLQKHAQDQSAGLARLRGEIDLLEQSVERVNAAVSAPDASGAIVPLDGIKAELRAVDLSDAATARPELLFTRAERLAAALRNLAAIKNDPEAEAIAQRRTPAIFTWLDEVEKRAARLRQTEAELEIWHVTLFAAWPFVTDYTRLGAVLSSIGVAQRNRYGMDGSLFLPHLMQVVPPATNDALQSRLSTIMFFINLASVVVLLGVVAAVLSADHPVGLGILVTLAGALVAAAVVTHAWPALVLAIAVLVTAVSTQASTIPAIRGFDTALVAPLWIALALLLASWLYRLSVTAAAAAAEAANTLVDLYRLKIFESCGFAAPRNAAEEFKMWQALARFVYRGERPGMHDLRYLTSPPDDGQDEESDEVLTPAQRVPSGTALDPTMFTPSAIPRSRVRALTVRTVGDLAGMVALRDLMPGEQVVKTVLCPAAEARRFVRMSIPVPAGSLHDALVAPDNLIALIDGTDVIDDVRVLAVNGALGGRLAWAIVAVPHNISRRLTEPSKRWTPISSPSSSS